MNDNEFNLAARAWLEDGPTRMSDHALLSALEEIHTTRQRRAKSPAWRATPVNIFARLAAAAVLLVAVGVVAANLGPRQPNGSTAGASPSPSSSYAFPATFVSPTYGYSFGYVDRGGLVRAKELWNPVTQSFPDFSGKYDAPFDTVETGLSAFFLGASTPIPAGVSVDAWVDEHVSSYCRIPRSQQPAITIDGYPGKIKNCVNEIDATVVAGGRLYLFILQHDDRSDARAFFDAFLATIKLHPEDAAVPSSTP